MSTVIRNQTSKNNPYHLSKHRYLELKHFCLQYPEWVYVDHGRSGSVIKPCADISKPTENEALLRYEYAMKRKLIEDTCKEADHDIWRYLLVAVTQDRAYPYLQTVMDIPCGRDMYYDRYRRFFWLLSRKKQPLL